MGPDDKKYPGHRTNILGALGRAAEDGASHLKLTARERRAATGDAGVIARMLQEVSATLSGMGFLSRHRASRQ